VYQGGEWSNSIQTTSDGGYIISYDGHNLGGIGILKLDSAGDIEWQKVYTEFDTGYEVYHGFWAASVRETPDGYIVVGAESTSGGYILAGSTESFGSGHSDIWVLKIDEDGNINDCSVVDSTNSA